MKRLLLKLTEEIASPSKRNGIEKRPKIREVNANKTAIQMSG